VGRYDGQKAVEYMQVKPGMTPYVPLTTFIDRRGMIRAQFLGNDPFFTKQAENIRSLARQLLAEKPPSRPVQKKKK
jgi:hypothetical protein